MPVAEVTEQELANYTMPEIREGAPIRWYRTGTAVRDSILGFVTRVRHRSVSVWLTTGLRYDTVRHLSDPKLKANSDQREQGAWDYTEDYKTQEEIKELQGLVKKLDARRVAAMEKVIDDQGSEIKKLRADLDELQTAPTATPTANAQTSVPNGK